MSDKLFHITPKQILSYLCDFERKLPFPQNKPYITSLTSLPITEENLSREALNMMHYIGLDGFTPKCTWKYIKDGTGGDILLDHNPDKIVQIRVSHKYSDNIKAICAVLAHEVCHKLLFEYQIYWPNFTDLTETSTDLCTLYVGLGKYVIEGYVASGTNDTQILGYLELPIYKRTLNLVDAILWRSEVNVNDDNSEPFLQEAHRLWSERSNKRNLLLDSYKDAFDKYGQLLMRGEIISQMIHQYVEYLHTEDLKEENNIYNEEWFENDIAIRPFAAFTGLYKSLVLKEQINTEKHIEEIIHHQNYLLYILRWSLPQSIVAHSAAENIYCPHCKNQFPSMKLLGKRTIVRCPKCGKRLFINGEIFDLNIAKDDYFVFRNAILKEAKEVLDRDNSREITKAFSDGEKAMEKKNLKAINQYRTQRDTTQSKYEDSQRELKSIKNKINNLPFWIKWLIGKRLD